MQPTRRPPLLVLGTALACLMAAPTTAFAKERLVFGGGPAGGTFQVVANAIQSYDSIKASEDYSVKAQSSAGSVENLRRVNSGRSDFGVVYSGHVYLGREGRLKNDPNSYQNGLAVARLFVADATLQ